MTETTLKTNTFKTNTQYTFGRYAVKVVDRSKHFVYFKLTENGEAIDSCRRKPHTSIKERTDWLSDTEYTEHVTAFGIKLEASSFN